MKNISAWKLAGLLFLSGFCALSYQVVWLRELRLIFGSSTNATGLVLAVFMGGLGVGALFLGRLADRIRNPLALYGLLEVGITASAALTPVFILLARKLYLLMGGSLAMGLPLATLVLIILSTPILLLPTLLMGGTLPAAARAVETAVDRGRRDLAILYGINTLGGVLGVGLTTFIFLELMGNQSTLWLACLLNALVGLAALFLARRDGLIPLLTAEASLPTKEEASVPGGERDSYNLLKMPAVSVAAFSVGFAFMLMELVWYRMLGPLLGGSTFTFGLILATALAGIGIGGILYGLRRHELRPTLAAFALTCGLEGLFMFIPFALGDRLALLTAMLKTLAAGGFHAQVFGWLLVTAIVVLPTAVIAGIQFPMLIALLGQGRKNVGSHTGNVYLWNTGGAIAGSLAGGFGLIPLLSAPGCWRLAVALLLFLCLATVFLSARNGIGYRQLLPSVAVVLATLCMFSAAGPTAVWRHSGIGATHHVNLTSMAPNQVREWQNSIRREVVWEKEGIESSVAMRAAEGLSFLVNGKADGHAIGDAGTQVMGPLVGALLHPAPKRGLVIGLGTGSSAGWLAQVPTMEQVDVAEIEPAILEVARWCAPVNFNVLEHPKIRILLGDGRELVQSGREKYDVIFSEPSNPYRAGIASLYTREFYHAVAASLAPNGYFSQWVQGYYIDGRTIRTIIATLTSVFSNVEIWVTTDSDLLFLCSMEDRPHSLPLIRRKVSEEPFRSALYQAWGVSRAEGFLGAYVGQGKASLEIATQDAGNRLNTDDLMLVEFDFARTAGRTGLFSTDSFRQNLRDRNLHRPALLGDGVDWDQVDENFFRIMLWNGKKISGTDGYSREQIVRGESYEAYGDGKFQPILAAWQNGVLEQQNLLEYVMLAEALADAGDGRAMEMAGNVRKLWPASGDGVAARYLWRSGEHDKAFATLASAFKGFRDSPWQVRGVVAHSLDLAMEMADQNFHSLELFDLLEKPLSVYQFEEYRKFALLKIGKNMGCRQVVRALEQSEPSVPWRAPLLEVRSSCYEATGSPLAARAAGELAEFRKAEGADLFSRPVADN